MEFTDKYRWELAAPPGATVVARATMPSHGHGTIPATVEGVKDEGSGLIVLEPLYLFMGEESGRWN